MVLPSFIFSDSPIQISAPLSMLSSPSLAVNMMEFIVYISCRSTLHQGFDCVCVSVHELCVKFESLLPSTALLAAADSLVEDCSEIFFQAKFLLRWPNRDKQYLSQEKSRLFFLDY